MSGAAGRRRKGSAVTPVLRRAATAVIIAAVCVTTALAAPAAAEGTARPTTTETSGVPGPASAYLALGDSVPFGFDPRVPLGDLAAYVGYPELAAPQLNLALANMSCPGQTSGGFIFLFGADNGCLPYRAVAPLHTAYVGSQLGAALFFLARHPKTRLVTLTLGANDLLLCRANTTDACTSPAEVASTLKTLSRNLTTTLRAIRTVYHGRLVAVTYYTINFADPTVTVPVQKLDEVLAGVTTAFGGTVADGYAAFAKASEPFGGNACAAGLLIPLTGGTCDAHPSRAGAALLAQVLVEAATRQ